MDATRITRQLEETIDEFERQKIRDIKVSSAVLYLFIQDVSSALEILKRPLFILASRKYLATL